MNKNLKKKLSEILPTNFSSDSIEAIVGIVDEAINEETKTYKQEIATKVSVYLKEQFDELVSVARKQAEADLAGSEKNILKSVCEAVAPIVGVKGENTVVLKEEVSTLNEQVEGLNTQVEILNESLVKTTKENKELSKKIQLLEKDRANATKELRKKFTGTAEIIAENLHENANADEPETNNFFLSAEVLNLNESLNGDSK